MPAQAVQAGDAARGDRRVPVGSRTESKACCNAGGGWERAAEYFEEERKYGLNCRESHCCVRYVSSIPTRRRKLLGISRQSENSGGPTMILTEEDWIECAFSVSGG
jgi:hypothetical protein